MIRRVTGGAILLLPLLISTALQGQAPEKRAGGDVRVHGLIVDRQTGDPLRNVSIRLSPDHGEAFETTTGPAGVFSLSAVPPGDYTLHVTLLGYEALEHEIHLSPESGVELQIELASEVIALEPVVVETVRESWLARAGFYERQRRGFGRFLTREEIEERAPHLVTDLFRTVPGVSVSTGGAGAVVTMRGGCHPDVFLDGMRMMPPFDFDDYLGIQDVEGVEIYRDTTPPPQYASISGCGSIVVWTREPGTDNGRPFSWRRLFVALGFLSAGLLFTR